MKRSVQAPRKMKVLFHHFLPFSLAHGGEQVQIEQTKTALERAGVEVEFLRWWDAAKGDQTGGDPSVGRTRRPPGLETVAAKKRHSRRAADAARRCARAHG